MREEARPANETDATIRQIIIDGDLTAISNLSDTTPPSLITFFNTLRQDSDDKRESWKQLAEALYATGLTASALAAFMQAIADGKGGFAWRADVYARISEIEDSLNMTWAAAADQRCANRLRGIRNTGGLFLELEAEDLVVQTAHNDPDGYDRILSSLPDSPLLNDPLRDPILAKRLALTPSPYQPATDDCSFFIMDGDGCPILQVEADAQGDRHLGCRETAIVMTRLTKSHPQTALAETLAIRQLHIALEWSGCAHAYFDVGPGDTVPPLMQSWIVNSDIMSYGYTAAWIDLSASEEEIERNYRDAHRQSLRWGRRNIKVTRTTTPDPVTIDLYERIHLTSGRHPAHSKDALATYLAEGRLNLYLGIFEEEPAVVLITARHGSTTYYHASAKIIHGNKPMGHIVLHQAIMDAKTDGQKRFDFGTLYESDKFSSKVQNIALYKRGFANHTEPHVVYRLDR